jgi:PAS domain S-box-containing protein
VVIGWLRIKGERAGLFESDEGVALVVITYTTSFLILIWLTAKSVNKIDASRRISEDALRRSEKHLQKAQEIAHLGSWELDIVNNQLKWSDEVYRIFGLKPQEFGATYTDFLNAIHSDDRAAVDAAYSSSLREGRDTYEIDHRIIRKSNGEIRFVHEKCEHFRNESGKIIRSVGMVHDVTEHKMSELALRESEEKYRLLFDRMTEGFALHEIILDDKGNPCDYKFLTINPAFEKLTGLKAENIIGKRVTEVLPGTEKNWIDNYGQVATMGVSIDFENFSSDLNSYFRVSAFSPKKGYFAVIFEDITSYVFTEKELRRTKDYLEKLINYANTPIIVWNPDTEIQLFNHAFEHLTGYSSAEVEGKKLDLLFPNTSLRESNLRIKNALTKNLESIEIPILTKKKEIRTVLWNTANIYDTHDNTVLSTVAQGNDITERINAEQNVKERTKDLEVANSLLKQELTERILAQQALRKSEAQLKELNATKDKFFNIIAHDLKNPFTSLIGSSELLYYNINQLNHEKIILLAKILNDSAKSGYAILQNLLDWSRSQTGLLNFNPEKINLKNLIDENILNLEQFSANKEIEMQSTVNETIFIFADKNMIKTILRNLLSNAVKFSYRYGKVFVSAVAGQDNVTVSVKDDGIGIPKVNIEEIFRIDANYSVPGTENEQGTGLGLKLSKEFVEKQGGKIWVESTENKGSVFKFSIPIKED